MQGRQNKSETLIRNLRSLPSLLHPTPSYRLVVSPNEISLIDAENHVAHAETGALRGAALLNVRHKNAPTQLGMFALDDHDA